MSLVIINIMRRKIGFHGRDCFQSSFSLSSIVIEHRFVAGHMAMQKKGWVPQPPLLLGKAMWLSSGQWDLSGSVMWQFPGILLKRRQAWASLVAQWLRVCLPMQGTRVRALVWEDPTCHGATGPVSHNYWACASGACAPQQERPRWWEARAPRWRVVPTCHN